MFDSVSVYFAWFVLMMYKQDELVWMHFILKRVANDWGFFHNTTPIHGQQVSDFLNLKSIMSQN